MDFKAYIGTKIINARPMSRHKFLKEMSAYPSMLPENLPKDEEGYLVIYPDKYQSWSPKKVFEAAYREVTIEERVLISSTGKLDGAWELPDDAQGPNHVHLDVEKEYGVPEEKERTGKYPATGIQE